MDQEIEYWLSAVQLGKVTDVPSFQETLSSFLRGSAATPKIAAYLSTKLFDQTASFASELETKLSQGDPLTRGVKKAICSHMCAFLKQHPRLVVVDLHLVFVGLSDSLRQVVQKRASLRRS